VKGDGHAVPDPAVRRLSVYLRQLEQMLSAGHEQVASSELADRLMITAAQVRKDLATFGHFGRRGVGYRIHPLIKSLRGVLGLHQEWKVVLVGAGRLGRALLQYESFRRRGFRLVAAFDIDPQKIGGEVGGVVIRRIDDLPRVVKRQGIKLAILAVPAEAAQESAERLFRCGIRGILNFAPTTIQSPQGGVIDPVDLAAHLEQLCFRVNGAAS
jgi:redox-sensing transcriptional repressor